jgi:MFS family permease
MALYLNFTLAFLSFVAFTVTRMLLSLYALDLGATPFAVGVISALFWAFPTLLSWPIGKVSDRFGARWLFTTGSVAGLAGLVIPGLFGSMAAVYIAASMGGLSVAVYNVVAQNLVGVISKPEERTKNFANFMVLGAASSFVGPLMAGYAIDHWGYSQSSLILSVVPLLGLALLLGFGGCFPKGHGEKRTASSLHGMLTGKGMPAVLTLSALVVLGADLFQFYLPIYGHELGFSASVVGMVTAALAVAGFSSRLAIRHLVARLGEMGVLTVALSMGTAGFLLMPLADNAIALGVVAAIFGFGMGAGQPVTVMLAYSLSEAGRAGETLGVRLTVNNLVRVVGPMLFGSIGTAFGMAPMFILNGLLLSSGVFISRRQERNSAHTAPESKP